jgi:putative membrane protein
MKLDFSRAAFGLISAAALCGSVLAEDATVNSSDKSFIQGAYKDGLAEVKMGQMGQEKTANPDVKAFAERMVKDHDRANAELKSLADSKRVEVATEPSLVAQGRAKMMEGKSGSEFDKAFVDRALSDHKDAIDTFEKASTEARDPDVKSFATKTLPTLRQHLETAESLQQKIGK